MSLFSRAPELYDFAAGGIHYRYIAGNKPLTRQQQLWQPATIKRSGISNTSDLTRNTLDITLPYDLPVLTWWRGTAPLVPITLTLHRLKHDVLQTLWTGVIGGCVWATSTATLHGLPPMAGLKAQGLRRSWQKSCPHVLYAQGLGMCNADKEAVRLDAVVAAVTGAVVTAAAWAGQADGWWAGGWIEWQAIDGHVERRFIENHAGDQLTLLTPAAPLTVGLTVKTYPGCDHTLTTCDSKFHNAVNYGGQPGIPAKNPFGGEPIY